MKLTIEQQRAVENGEVVKTTINGIACVLIRKEAFDRLTAGENGESELRETYAAAMRAWDAAGSPEDEALYDDVAE